MTREIKKLDKNIFELKCSAFKDEGYTLWKLRKNWELIAGDIIAEKSEPKNLYMRELTVYVHDPVIHHSIVSYSSIIMKKINEFFQRNVVEKVEVRKINKNLRKNVLDFSQKEKSEKISEINEKTRKKVLFQEEEQELSFEEREKIRENIEKTRKKVLFQEEEQELSFEEREKIRENIEKIDKKYENFAIRLKEIAENNRKKEKYLLKNGFIKCSECGKIFYPGENEKICFNCYDRKESRKIDGMARLLTEMPLIGERDAVRMTETDAYTYYKVRDMLAQRVYRDLLYFCIEKNLQIKGNEEWSEEIRKETIVDFEIYVKNYIDFKIGTDNMEIFSKEREKVIRKLNNDRRFRK